ncbi:MAG: hypothetical protein AB7V42_06700 [Thermoleophilia bacterium]
MLIALERVAGDETFVDVVRRDGSERRTLAGPFDVFEVGTSPTWQTATLVTHVGQRRRGSPAVVRTVDVSSGMPRAAFVDGVRVDGWKSGSSLIESVWNDRSGRSELRAIAVHGGATCRSHD